MSPLKKEIEDLRVAIHEDESWFSKKVQEFHAFGHVCCPACAFGEEWSRRAKKQIRRVNRLKQLLKKLRRDEQTGLRLR